VLGCAYRDLRRVIHGRPGLDALLPGHRGAPREDEGLGPRARLGEAALDEEDVEPLLLQTVTITFRTLPP
jgi:hypothetical protein